MNELNARFYRDNAASFSQTRQSGWPGWERCLAEARMAGNGATPEVPMRVLDLACGNLRFARYLADACSQPIQYLGIDNCPELGADASPADFPPAWQVRTEELDVVSALLSGTLATSLGDALARAWGTTGAGPRAADLSVAFGFLHHVPTFAARLELLRALLAATAPGDTCCVSFWRFMSSECLAAKARATTERGLRELGLAPGDLGQNDYLLGWQNVPGSYRYCHHFCKREVDALLARLDGLAQPVARFAADGRSGELNAYVVLRRS
ncbi:MAG: class I SAM-dependent methyltransferase [Parafannyhessea sp.]|uniref:class I SAM-dependent methyltransferase n=1 Tax=Parafannyhessea sp. TaxID=2847324 RepID=UPI003EFD8A74